MTRSDFDAQFPDPVPISSQAPRIYWRRTHLANLEILLGVVRHDGFAGPHSSYGPDASRTEPWCAREGDVEGCWRCGTLVLQGMVRTAIHLGRAKHAPSHSFRAHARRSFSHSREPREFWLTGSVYCRPGLPHPSLRAFLGMSGCRTVRTLTTDPFTPHPRHSLIGMDRMFMCWSSTVQMISAGMSRVLAYLLIE